MRIAVPNKGRLHKPTVELLEKAGLHIKDGSDRKLYAETVDDDVDILYARASDIPEYIEEGAADLGITGLDQMEESGVDIEPLLDLGYGTCSLVLAVPEDSSIDSVDEVEGCRVATEFPGISRGFFDEHGIDVDLVHVSGATELTPNAGMADAIIDLTSTGTTLEVNSLRVVTTILESSVYLFANKDVVGDREVDELRNALDSVIQAKDKRYLMMNVPEEKLGDVKEVMPGLGGPTVMKVEGNDSMLAVHAVVEEDEIYEVINEVRRRGASDVLVVPIERMMR